MNAEIIAVGSELLTPDRIDTNSLFLTGELNALGVEVVAKAVIGDDLNRLADTLKAAIERSEIVITSGGLGPTEDDLTRDALAQASGRKLVYRQDLCDRIEDWFHRIGKEMAGNNKRQAWVVEGAEALENGNGTAPALWLEPAPGRVVILLPGPPRELEPLFSELCQPRLVKMLPAKVIRTLQFRVTGIGESDLDHLIAPVYKRYENPVTTVLASPGDVQIHLRARCDTEEEAEALLSEIGLQIEEILGDLIYSRNGDPLEAAAGAILREQKATVAVAESCTGGALAQTITSVPGSSDYFAGGFLVYTADLKERLLGVDAGLIRRHTVVSAEVAEAMAASARERTGATYALGVTGEAGPESSTGEPPGTVFIGLAGPEGVQVRKVFLLGDRERVRRRAVLIALDMLRRAALGLDIS